MKIIKRSLPPIAENCYVVCDEATKQCFVIDPGGSAELILADIESADCQLVGILLTHGHADHTMGAAALREATRAPIFVHEADMPLLEDASLHRFFKPEPLEADKLLKDRDELVLGETILKVIHTPGHTPGSCCFLAEGQLFTGDTLFLRDVGRTDLWQGSYETLVESIRSKLFGLPEETVVCPGHEGSSSIGVEKAENRHVID